MRILVIQTAFLGDVLLTLPLIRALKEGLTDAIVDAIVTPLAAGLLESQPDIHEVILFDKRGEQKGARALLRLGADLRRRRYDVVVSPHKSFRSAMLVLRSGAQRRIGFSDSAFRWAFTDTVPFEGSLHEIDRNLQLLGPLGIHAHAGALPRLIPPQKDIDAVRQALRDRGVDERRMIAIAPGSVWYTKRWPESSFTVLVRSLEERGWTCVLVGASEDAQRCSRIIDAAGTRRAISFAGTLQLLQSAVLIGMCRALVANDSAPMHMGVAMGTPVSAVFGPTLPAFGFAPRGPKDRIFETTGLTCRPCSKHGGDVCPVGTFACMVSITPSSIVDHIGSP